ncbi:hypothetical protein N7465_000038 [Penicillium sp. CMV-2018d]|nr:hypothetical protein N7465_000038 [Penicillium sp. CMV-2018d]
MFAKDSASGRLERIHCVIASRILERNESDSASYNYIWTQDVDKELHRAAQSAVFWEMRRLQEQLFHYNLLNQLHLPYMLRESVERKFEYSRITSVNSCREILSRFIMLRRWSRVAFSCRTIDFTALMAAMTLLLAHLDSHRSPMAQDNMEELNRLNPDTLNARSAQLLARLLAIEAKAAGGDPQSAQSVSVQGAGTGKSQSHDMTTPNKHEYIPYFGVIKTGGIGRADGMSSQTVAMRAGTEAETQAQPSSLAKSIPSDISTKPNHKEINSNGGNYSNNDVTALFAPLLSKVLSDDPKQQFEYLGTAAIIEYDPFKVLDLVSWIT